MAYPSLYTPHIGLALYGADEVILENFSLLDQAYGSGSSVNVNGSLVVNPNFGSLPAAPGGDTNVTFQVDINGNVSAYVPTGVASVAWSALTGILSNGQVIPYGDAGISRLGAASLAFGNGTPGDTSAQLQFGTILVNGTYSGDIVVDNKTVTFTGTAPLNQWGSQYQIFANPGGNSGINYIGQKQQTNLDGPYNFTGSNAALESLSVFFGSGNCSKMSGSIQASVSQGTAGSLLVNNYGNYVESGSQTVTGTITNDYTKYIASPSTTGLISNHYGIYIADQTVGGANNPNPYALYIVAGKSLFGGPVLLNNTLVDGTGSVGTSGQVLSSTVTGTAWVAGGGSSLVFNVTSYGATGNGVTDDTSAIVAATAAASAAGGGIVFFPVGNYLIGSHIILPNSGTGAGSNPYSSQIPIRWTGVTADHGGEGANPSKGSILLMQYSGAGTAKIETYGLGLFEMDHLSLYDSTGDSVPFLFTTGTTLNIHDNAFVGSKSGVGCNQDVILLGGYLGNFSGVNNTNAAFQGYNTYIQRNYFNGIRRAAYFKTYCGSTDFSNNFIGPHCGSNLTAATLTLTAAANASSGTTVYTGTITGGASNGLATQSVVIAGFDIAANNTGGSNPNAFNIVSSTATTITVNNANGVADTHAGTAVTTGGSAIELDGTYQIGAGVNENFITHNRFEISGYAYGGKFLTSNNNYISGNDFEDNSSSTALWYFDAHCTYNMVIDMCLSTLSTEMVDLNGTNTLITSAGNSPSAFNDNQGITSNGAMVTTGSNPRSYALIDTTAGDQFYWQLLHGAQPSLNLYCKPAGGTAVPILQTSDQGSGQNFFDLTGTGTNQYLRAPNSNLILEAAGGNPFVGLGKVSGGILVYVQPSYLYLTVPLNVNNKLTISTAGAISMIAGQVISWNGDTDISRLAAGSLAIGTGAQGSIAGNLSYNRINTAGSDHAGQVTVTAGNTTQAQAFAVNYAGTGQPVVVVTPTSDPLALGVPVGYWVTYSGSAGAWTGFTVNIQTALAGNVTFNYLVIGAA